MVITIAQLTVNVFVMSPWAHQGGDAGGNPPRVSPRLPPAAVVWPLLLLPLPTYTFHSRRHCSSPCKMKLSSPLPSSLHSATSPPLGATPTPAASPTYVPRPLSPLATPSIWPRALRPLQGVAVGWLRGGRRRWYGRPILPWCASPSSIDGRPTSTSTALCDTPSFH
jgi:hypothetical protein